ncbi:MAG: hypothetical protein WDW38_005756 [Sanguina aurantia]
MSEIHEDAQTTDDQMPSSTAEPSGSSPSEEELSFTITYGKNSSLVSLKASTTVGDLKAQIESSTGVPRAKQKLLQKGVPLKDDNKTLAEVGIKQKSKLLLIGSSVSDVLPTESAADVAWDAAPAAEAAAVKPEVHAKVLSKGRPEDGWPGVAGRQVLLGESVVMIPGLLNSQGTKKGGHPGVLVTFKPELQQLLDHPGLAYGSIRKIEATPIEGQEEYSILSLNLGTTSSSIMRLYFFPSQHVASIKIRILGVQSLV